MSAHPGMTEAARLQIRRQCRVLLRQRDDVGAHLTRIHASLQLPGVEPVQGALADLFGTFGADATALKTAALQLAASRLGDRLAARFAACVTSASLPPVSPLATRWSLLVCPSADVSTRARRCSADDSRALAAQFLQGEGAQVEGVQVPGAESAQDRESAFLHHCLTCHDKLAFMLVRRQLLQRNARLPARWAQAERTLLNEGVSL